MLQNSPPVGTYDPKHILVRPALTKEFKITDATPRFDEQSFKKKILNSPDNLFYDVTDSRVLTYQDKYHEPNVSAYR